jgi:hypothetical protein
VNQLTQCGDLAATRLLVRAPQPPIREGPRRIESPSGWSPYFGGFRTRRYLPQRRICLIRGEAIACDDNGLAVSDIEDNETIVSALKRASRCTFWRRWRLLAYDFRIRPANLLARASSFCEVVHRGGNLGVKELQTYPGHGGSYAFSLALRNTRCPCGFSYGRVKTFRDITDVRRQQKS